MVMVTIELVARSAPVALLTVTVNTILSLTFGAELLTVTEVILKSTVVPGIVVGAAVGVNVGTSVGSMQISEMVTLSTPKFPAPPP